MRASSPYPERRLYTDPPGDRSYPSRFSTQEAAALSERRTPVRLTASVQPSHSITSSTRASIKGGIVRPSALAVLRLITSSNLVGC
jgi:hypothetical protein